MKNKKNILITGGAGFIGSHLIDLLLDKDFKVTCVDNLYLGRKENIKHQLHNENFAFYKFDVLNFKKLNDIFRKERFDAIFHLVANSDIKQSAAQTDLDLKLNFMSTYNVLEAMRLNNVNQIVFASTSAIFGETDEVITEDMGPLIPISFYGASKLAAEAYISAYVHNFGTRAWLIRFPNVVGERATHGILFDLMNKLKENQNTLNVLGNGKQEKPYLYVKELVEGLIYVWQNANENYNYFNLGSDSTIKVSGIVEILIDELNLKGRTQIKYSGGDRGWVGDVPKFKYSLNKANKLGWKANLNSEQAIRLTVKKLKEEFGF
ncbi:UDP-glucose 4-epimerase [Candidatus Kuenenia stuttgartiensis]|uniref:Similar to uridine 5'-diphospho-glucose 4-epimerase n=1 Tax=Kuenenia stuttgartiensis TaxID=174633 RepID=Q1Q6W8_KUEST|nr:NAD-dependent epimerase/dehydratase family protein [Candidatus Kuenenia stuttgartiensis]QII12876.1 UDP-glucose 4-epimerase [Candidatus Kuenenia stuttgartiensis]CAJ73315.1 similar to uridine 5'-diphospho-glucose 4-epimerase [Candidatus Kuenenia stuttgartiensis]